jgi:predicted dehydrogenase
MDHVLLLDMSIHTFDAARFLSNARPVRVFCHEWNPAGSWYKHGASAVAIFEMDNGVVFTYRGSWCAEGLATAWNSNWRIIGQQGSLLWTGDALTAQRITNNEGFVRATEDLTVGDDPDTDAAKGHESLIRDFINCVRTGRTPATTYADNIHSLAMVFAAVESAEKKQPIDIVL